MAYTKEDIITQMQTIAEKLGKNFITQKEWNQYSNIHSATVTNRFGSRKEAVSAAGLKPTDSAKISKEFLSISDDDLLENLIRLYKEYGKITGTLVDSKGRYSSTPYKKRWKTVKAALAEALSRINKGELAGDSEALPNSHNDTEKHHVFKNSPSNSSLYGLHVSNEKIRPKKRSIVGEPIDFRGMRFAPVNEQGVVYLFGMMSQELGFLIESVRVKYPDCEGKRCCDPKANLREHIYIEFEYKSSNFVEHGHNIDECDLIVCWIHDWTDCPIEVLELKEAIRTLPRAGLTK